MNMQSEGVVSLPQTLFHTSAAVNWDHTKLPHFTAYSINMQYTVYLLMQSFLLTVSLGIPATVCTNKCICNETNNAIFCEGVQLSSLLYRSEWCPNFVTIYNNTYTDLEEMAPLNCSAHIQHLHIINGGVMTIQPNAFNELDHLYWINIKGNTLNTLDYGFFKGLNSLEVLFLEENDITNINAGAFIGLPQLKTLSLSKNSISELDNEVFLPLQRLKQLRIANNYLETLKPEYFSGLYALNKLNLSGNKISTLHTNAFVNLNNDSGNRTLEEHPLQNLQLMYLHDNLIKIIQTGAFEGLDKLGYLNMNNNKMGILKLGMFHGLMKLSDLRINNCGIHTIAPRTFRNLKELRELHMKNNKLEHLKQSLFEGLSQLQVLIISENKIKSIETNVFKILNRLKFINLNNNSLNGLPQDIFKYAGSIEKMFIAGNKIKDLPNDIFKCLINLDVINLDNNGIHTIHDRTFFRLKSLQTLSLRNNNIESLTNDTPVHFYNPPKNLRKPYINLKELKVLDLNGNYIDVLPSGVFKYIPKLSSLNLGNNKLQRLNDRALLDVKKLKELEIHGNPLNCDCDLKTTKQWLTNKNVNVTLDDGVEPLCSDPPSEWSIVLDKLNCDKLERKLSLLEQFGLFMIGPAAIVLIGLISWGYSRMKKRSKRKERN